MTLKPKNNSKERRPSGSWPLGLPPLNNVKKSWKKKNNKSTITAVVTICLLLLYFLLSHLHRGTVGKRSYPTPHGLYLHDVPASSSLIFPQVEHAPILKEMGIKGLYVLRMEADGDSRYVMKPEEIPLPADEKKKITSQTLLVKKSFLDHGKLVYRKNNSPNTVVVTLIDFENYELDTLVSVVQNRVDYAQKQNYGVYIRWIQEFVPLLSNQKLEENGSFCKSMVMRAAMYAFPNAKRFIFIDDTSLITDYRLSVDKNIMDPTILDVASLKDTSVSPDSVIKTYNNLNLADISMVFAHDNKGEISTSTFIISNDVFSKALIDYINDPIIEDFEWENLSHALGHILQWHPELLYKTTLVYPKLFASEFDASMLNPEESDSIHYTVGDFIATFPDCKSAKTCNKDITSLYKDLTMK